MTSQAPPGQTLTLCDFSQASEIESWSIVDDRVMGGKSQGQILSTSKGIGLFKGQVSTANNGGFSSVRKPLRANVSDYEFICIKIKGDGKSYQLRLKEKSSDQYSFIQNVKTTGEWEIVELLLSDFYPVFRGRRLSLPNFEGKSLSELAFLIGNKVNESFEFQIDTIYLK